MHLLGYVMCMNEDVFRYIFLMGILGVSDNDLGVYKLVLYSLRRAKRHIYTHTYHERPPLAGRTSVVATIH